MGRPQTDTVIVNAATAEGMAIMRDIGAGDYASVEARGYHGFGIGKPLRDLSPLSTALDTGLAEVRSVANSFDHLVSVAGDLSTIPRSSNNIWMAYVDDEHNRVVAVMPSIADDLAAEIVRRYGTDLVAIRLDSQDAQPLEPLGSG